jgi:hypothetical protein
VCDNFERRRIYAGLLLLLLLFVYINTAVEIRIIKKVLGSHKSVTPHLIFVLVLSQELECYFRMLCLFVVEIDDLRVRRC